MAGFKKIQGTFVMFGLLSLVCLLGEACKSDEPRAQTGQVRKPFNLALMVNQARAAELDQGMPLWVTARLENTDKLENLVLKDVNQWQVKVLPKGKDKPLAIEWHELAAEEIDIAPGEVFRAAWVLKSSLEPGSYVITITGVPAKIRVKPAYASISLESASEQEIARARRMVLALRGEVPDWLSAVEKALSKDPGNHALGYERVQAYKANKDYAKAHEALAGLIRQVKMKGASQGKKRSPHLPSWYFAELSLLKKAAAQNP
ncbi:hypothetical protein [Dethiosulfatarculus sandiegensis]|uniref:Uncharacterized protein n=1 Tax=Dethiosulfatarculus sandiegensis TaxID=1429043 RepID=A0A0D2J962_9BACT|nr:hypothetical protein [Dethiosulfatarculus sandiegensis]KIX14699.1 hypothetical protein X474_07330 [Dethiosulfatarculus sandiegensis]